jgi:hypothetical protein
LTADRDPNKHGINSVATTSGCIEASVCPSQRGVQALNFVDHFEGFRNMTDMAERRSDILSFAIKACVVAVLTIIAVDWVVDNAIRDFQNMMRATMVDFGSLVGGLSVALHFGQR